jgi:hypothetical protein
LDLLSGRKRVVVPLVLTCLRMDQLHPDYLKRLVERVKSGTAPAAEARQGVALAVVKRSVDELRALLEPPHNVLLGFPDSFPAPFKEQLSKGFRWAVLACLQTSSGPYTETQSFKTIEILLDGGYRPSQLDITTIIFEACKMAKEEELTDGLVVAWLKYFTSRGVSVKDLADFGGMRGGVQLLHLGAKMDFVDAVKYAIEELGCDIDASCKVKAHEGPDEPCTSLKLAFLYSPSASGYLLKKGARVVFEGLPWIAQPLVTLIENVCFNVADISAEPLLARIVAKERDLLDPKYALPDEDGNTGNMIASYLSMAETPSLEILELFCTMEGAAAAINTPTSVTGSGAMYPIAFTVMRRNWDAFAMLLRYGARITDNGVANRVQGDPSCPRKVKLLVDIAIKKEKKAREATAAAKATGAVTNAAEDPSVKVLTEREEKKKAKKRAAKKKAKAKNRAALQVTSAGAGAEAKEDEADYSSSDSGDETGEEGMDEEEKLLARAPTFDLEKEKKKRAEEAEKAKKGDGDAT